MNRLVLLLITITGTSFLAACGDAEIIVHAQQSGAAEEGSEPTAIRDLPIRLLPYDRDAIFDSLAAAHPVPQPEIPDTLMKLRDAMAQAYNEWNETEHRWATVRDSLIKLNETMKGLSRASGEYRVLYREFQELEPLEGQLNRRKDAAFARFTELQSEVVKQSEEVRLLREAWEDEAYASVDMIIFETLKQLGRPELADTTRATGSVRLKAKPGKWWVTARYELPYEELYWNIPVELKRGEPVELRLTPENAEVRPKL